MWVVSCTLKGVSFGPLFTPLWSLSVHVLTPSVVPVIPCGTVIPICPVLCAVWWCVVGCCRLPCVVAVGARVGAVGAVGSVRVAQAAGAYRPLWCSLWALSARMRACVPDTVSTHKLRFAPLGPLPRAILPLQMPDATTGCHLPPPNTTTGPHIGALPIHTGYQGPTTPTRQGQKGVQKGVQKGPI